MKILRIVSCLLACLSVAAIVPVGIFSKNLVYITIPIASAALFAFIMFFARGKSAPAPPAEVDFMNTDEENAAIREERKREADKNQK